MVSYYVSGFACGVVPAALFALLVFLKRSFTSVVWE